jgi:hypothetical protein
MKPITKILTYSFSAGMLFLASCTPDDQEPVPKDSRDQYLGTWTCSENSKQNGQSTYNVNLKINTSDKDQMLIDNLYNYGFNKTAYFIINASAISIPSQTYSGSNTLSGSGTISSSSKINLTFYVKDGASTDTCTAVLTK